MLGLGGVTINRQSQIDDESDHDQRTGLTEWELHCRGAIGNGVTKQELRAIIHVIGIYCGVLKALECIRRPQGFRRTKINRSPQPARPAKAAALRPLQLE